MSGIKYLTQLDMKQAPTELDHVIRNRDLISYVGSKIKDPVRVVATSAFVATYDSGALALTQDTAGVVTIDGVTVALNDRILLTAQTPETNNGIYTVTTLGTGAIQAVLTRADDFDEDGDIVPYVKIPIAQGTVNGVTTWVLTTDAPITLDTTDLIFQKESGGAAARIAEKIFTITGDGATTDFPFTHDWNTYYVTGCIYDNTGYENVGVLLKRTSVNAVQVEFGVAPAVGENYTLILRAQVTV